MSKDEMIEILLDNSSLIEDLNNIPEEALKLILENAGLLKSENL
jgi:hypothetical protein